MSNSKYFQTILNGTIHALKSILPMDIEVKTPSIISEPFQQQQMGVLIGLIGDVKGRVIIDSSPEVFSGIGNTMFGMPLEGAMLESFTGEFGNMIAGNLCTAVGQESLEIDITPPTVMVGNTKLYGFEKAFVLPITVPSIGALSVLLTIEEGE